jgi:hypothetical protein
LFEEMKEDYFKLTLAEFKSQWWLDCLYWKRLFWPKTRRSENIVVTKEMEEDWALMGVNDFARKHGIWTIRACSLMKWRVNNVNSNIKRVDRIFSTHWYNTIRKFYESYWFKKTQVRFWLSHATMVLHFRKPWYISPYSKYNY